MARFEDGASLSVEAAYDEFTSHVRVRGEVDLSNTDLVAAALQFALRSSTLRLTLDLSEVTFFSVSGLRVLLWLQGVTAKDAVEVVLIVSSPQIMRVLEVTDAVFDFRIQQQAAPDAESAEPSQ